MIPIHVMGTNFHFHLVFVVGCTWGRSLTRRLSTHQRTSWQFASSLGGGLLKKQEGRCSGLTKGRAIWATQGACAHRRGLWLGLLGEASCSQCCRQPCSSPWPTSCCQTESLWGQRRPHCACAPSLLEHTLGSETPDTFPSMDCTPVFALGGTGSGDRGLQEHLPGPSGTGWSCLGRGGPELGL